MLKLIRLDDFMDTFGCGKVVDTAAVAGAECEG